MPLLVVWLVQRVNAYGLHVELHKIIQTFSLSLHQQFGSLANMDDIVERVDSQSAGPLRKMVLLSPDTEIRFPKLEECAHFHYDVVELASLEVLPVIRNRCL